jgi:hypothetical protein
VAKVPSISVPVVCVGESSSLVPSGSATRPRSANHLAEWATQAQHHTGHPLCAGVHPAQGQRTLS